MIDETITPPPSQETPAPIPIPPKAPVASKKTLWIIAGFLGAGILIFSILYFRSARPNEEVPLIPTPTEMPTPTPTPNVSRIATTSAFSAYSAEIASFSATVNNFTLQDSTLAPPILDLELGL